MPRRAKPWWRGARMEWYVTIQGQQHPTGVKDPNDLAGAQAAQERILAEIAAQVAKKLTPPPEAPSGGRSAKDAVADFLDFSRRRVAAGRLGEGALRGYRSALQHFAKHFGDRPLSSLTAEEVEAWGDQPEWSSSTRHNYLTTVLTLCRWCRIGLRVKRPPRESRGADCVLSDEQFARVLRELRRVPRIPGDLPEMLRVLRETGARPGEIAGLTVEDVDWANACTRLKKHKTKAKTGRDRVIHFPAAAVAVLQAQRERYGSGLLFRTRRGNRFSPIVIAKRMADVSARLGFRALAYSCRHSFATKALTMGVPDTVVSALLGHASTAMIHANYSHVSEQSRVLKEAVERVSRKDAG